MAYHFASLLNELSGQSRIVARYEEQRGRELAPRFNVLKYMGENAVTSILRDLLDPRGDHGQGALFLKKFLAMRGLSIDVGINALWSATIRTQESTTNGRLLDLVIDLPNGAYCGLENKIGAAEQPDQVRDYIRFTREKRPGNWKFVFLTPSGTAPRGSYTESAVHNRPKT
jgi:hypothetical protein